MDSWVRRGLVGRLVALIIVVGVAASCGGGESNSGTDSGGDDAGTGNSGGDDQSDDDVAWVPFGPNDPDIPTPSWPAYNAFADGNCSALRDYLSGEGSGVGEFGSAMAAVCAAAIEGDQGQWEVAEAALAAADPSTLANDCLASVVEDLLRRAIEWHNRNPGKTPEVRFNRVADTTECGAQNESDEDTTDDETDTDEDTTDDETETDDDTTDDETETDDDTTDDETDTEGSTEGDETSEATRSLRWMSA